MEKQLEEVVTKLYQVADLLTELSEEWGMEARLLRTVMALAGENMFALLERVEEDVLPGFASCGSGPSEA